MIKSKKQMFIVIGAFALVMLLGTVTYAFFNYTRTGVGNTIRVGRIAFVSRQTETISLNNLFPIDPTDSEEMSDTTKVGTVEIEIEGDTDYVDGVEYLVSSENTYITTSGGKVVPISLDVEVTNLGTSSNNYFVSREDKNATIYKKLVGDTIVGDQMLLVGYIKPNTTSGTIEGVNGNLTIKAYLDKNKILISDTYDGTESDNMGTSNSMAQGKTVLTTTEWNALTTGGASFKVKVEANEGIWVEKPMAINTIKKNLSTPMLINFGQNSSPSNGEGLYILPGTENNTNPIYYYRGAVTNNNVIFGGYCWQIVRTTDTGGIKMIYGGPAADNGTTCLNIDYVNRRLQSSLFVAEYNHSFSMSSIGYMNNKMYLSKQGITDGAIYGKNVEWDGTNYLVIEDTANIASTNTTLDANHHYTCGTESTTSCTSVRYYYYKNGSSYYYIILTDGEKVEDALYKMTGNGTEEIKQKNAGYVLNQNDSKVKSIAEEWFRINLTNEVDSTKRNYASYLEDTIYCNNRSFKTTGSRYTYALSGWNPNGGSLNNDLYFGASDKMYSTSNIPSLECPNETDRFSVGSSMAHLKYPIGLLTSDEVVMAGASGYGNNTYYLYNGNYSYSWTITSFNSHNDCTSLFSVDENGSLFNTGTYAYSGIRPVISLKPGTEFEIGGEGTTAKPYVVKYE